MPWPPQHFLRSLSTFSSNSHHHLSLLACDGPLSLLSSFPCPSCVGKASALSHTPAEAGQRCVSPQDEKPGTGVPGQAPGLHLPSRVPAASTLASFLRSMQWDQRTSGSGRQRQGVRAFGSSPGRGQGEAGAQAARLPAPQRGLSGAGCSRALGSPHGGGVLLTHSGHRLLGVLVPLTLDRSSLRSPLRSLPCIQSFASALASGGTLPKTVDLGFSF